MKIYNYDGTSGEYIGQSEAQKSPLEENVYLIPANATDKQPLASKNGFAVCFKEGAWQYVKDDRGAIYYDENNREVKITSLGQDTLGLRETPKEPPIEQLREAKTAELARWTHSMGDSCKINLKGFGLINGGYRYLLNVEAMIDTFDSLEVRAFRMYDNSMKKINGQEELKHIKKAIQIGGQKLHTLKWGYELKISKAKDKKELDAITFADTIEVAL
jgi:3-deoxy-D-arabino-heptulosonate 7-phosphate synthase|nr:MAG TPA: tail fiber assembly protein [Caudoviricetes sp.]